MNALPRFHVACAITTAYLCVSCGPAPTEHVLKNDALELRVRTSAEHTVGGIELTGIRDLRASRDWLTQPSPLFELSADGVVWTSSTGFVVDSVVRRDTSGLTLQAHTHRKLPDAQSKPLDLQVELRIEVETGSGLARIDGTVRNPNADWIGPFTMGDHDQGPLPEFPRDAHIAAVPPRNGVEEILIAGFDGILYGSEERDDGPWSAPRPLQDTSVPAFRDRFVPGAPIAAVRRNDHQRDAFAIDRNGTLLTVFRLDDGWWSPPISISTGIGRKFQPGGSVAALSVNEQTDPPAGVTPRQNEVAVFAISSEGQILGAREVNDGPFSAALPINASSLRLPPAAQLAAVKRNQTQQDLFVVDGKGQLLTTFHTRGAALWSGFIPLSQPSPRIRPGSALAAVRGSGDDEYAFVVGQCADIDNNLGCVYETHEKSDGAWSTLAPITPPIPLLPAGSPITAIRRTGSEMDVFFARADGSVYTVARLANGQWSNVSELPIRLSSVQVRLAAMMRRPDQLDLFAVEGSTGHVRTTADGRGTVYLRTVFPKVRFEGADSLAGAYGMVPQEMGGLVPLRATGPYNLLGMPYHNDEVARDIGLSEGMNSLEVVNIARAGRSLFFLDRAGESEAGRAPIQFTLGPNELTGFWVAMLKGHHQLELPSFGIGVADGDFRHAIDAYTALHPATQVAPDTPTWLSEAGAIYAASGGGSGGIYLDLPGVGITLTDYTAGQPCGDVGITFRCTLRRMWREAQDFGTSVLYLNDYWEAVDPPPVLTCPDVTRTAPGVPDSLHRARYFCKGDYFINAGLGGMAALRSAIDEVHESGGHVILYLEPFAIDPHSAVGNAYADLWGERFRGSPVWKPFPDSTTAMSQSNGEWQSYIVELARQLIDASHADGVFLDSGGWRLNVPGSSKQENIGNSPLEMQMAFLNLVDRVRAAIRKDHPQAVVLSETTSGPMWRHVDGGVSADLNHSSPAFTGVVTQQGSLLTSPTRYALPQMNVFSNGLDVNQLNQVFATGHGLALSTNYGIGAPNFMFENRGYLRGLVQARQTLASALVHGRQIAQVDATGDGGALAIAYSYTGTPPVETILNPGTSDFVGTVPVHGVMQSGTQWRDVLSGEVFTVGATGVAMTVPRSSPPCTGAPQLCGLRILRKQ